MRICRLFLLLTMSLTLAGCAAFKKPAATTDDGLDYIDGSRFDELYVRSDVDFSSYDSIFIETLTVEFDRNWQRDQNRNDPSRVREKDIERIKQALSDDFVDIFAADIATSNGYTIADKPGPRTLVFKPAITDLRINNPTNNQPYSITVLAEEAGQMRINLEMRDGESEERVLTLSDFTRGLSYGQTLVNQNVVRNKQESTFIMRRWARSLNEVIAAANESAART